MSRNALSRALPSSARAHLSRAVVAGVALLAFAGAAAAQDVEHGEEVFHLCGTCHGNAGEGLIDRAAPRIAGLPAWYLKAQLDKFEAGIRAYHADDTEGLQMKPMARYAKAGEREDDVIAYIATLDPAPSAATVEGDVEAGKLLYTPCQACHGVRAEGNEILKAPGLAQQSDWYLVTQLHKFRQGLRGTHKDDITGAQMRAMSMTLTTDQAVKDVVAYIRSLGE